MNVGPAKRFPYSEITGFCVNKYTNSVRLRDVYACGRRLDPLLPAFCRARERDITLPDLIRSGVGLLRVTASIGDDVCWRTTLVTVQRLPSRSSSLTTNSSRRVSITAGLGFILPTPSASSHVPLAPPNPERGSERPQPPVPAPIQLQTQERGRGVRMSQRNLQRDVQCERNQRSARGGRTRTGCSQNNSWSPSHSSSDQKQH